MASSTPIREGILQSTLDLNNQALSNYISARKYNIVTSAADTYTLSTSDINSIITLSYSGTVVVTLPNTVDAPIGAEILLLCSDVAGSALITTTGGAQLVYSASSGNVIKTPYGLTRLLCVGSGVWASAGNYTYNTPTLLNSYPFEGEDCCGNPLFIYQQKNVFDNGIAAYDDLLQASPSNIPMFIINTEGYAINAGSMLNGTCADVLIDYAYAATFYDNTGTSLSMYNTDDADPTDVSQVENTLWRSAPGSFYACDDTYIVNNTTLYGIFDFLYFILAMPYCFNNGTAVEGECP